MNITAGERYLSLEKKGEVRAELDVAALVRMYSALLYRVAFSIVRQPAEAEDIVQEVFVRVLETGNKVADVRDMRPWLVRITWNCALDRKRRRTPMQMDDEVARALLSREPGAESTLAQATELTAVLAALDKLPKNERKVLLLLAMDELTTAEVAGIVGRSESSVRSIAFRARARLQERLQKGGHR